MKREEEKEKKVRPATLPARGTRALTPPPQRVRAERERKRREGLVVSSSSEEEEDSESSDWPGKEEAKAKAAAEAEAEAEQKKRADWERTKAQREEKQAKREALVRGRTGGEGNGGADTIRDARLAPSQEGAAALEAGGREGEEGAPSNPPRTRDSCTDPANPPPQRVRAERAELLRMERERKRCEALAVSSSKDAKREAFAALLGPRGPGRPEGLGGGPQPAGKPAAAEGRATVSPSSSSEEEEEEEEHSESSDLSGKEEAEAKAADEAAAEAERKYQERLERNRARKRAEKEKYEKKKKRERERLREKRALQKAQGVKRIRFD